MKRLIFILGGKGGVGKTLCCRSLYYFLSNAGLKTLGFDADIENPEFEDYHNSLDNPVVLVDFLGMEGARTLLSMMATASPDVAIIDMPGASNSAMREQFQRLNLVDLAEGKLGGYRVTIVSVMNNCYNVIASLSAVLEELGDQADYVVVKSQFWANKSHGLDFSRWEASEERQQFLAQGGIELEMPVLEMCTFDAMHEGRISFFKSEEMGFGDQVLVDSFINRFMAQIRGSGAWRYLGLQEPAEGSTAIIESEFEKAKTAKKSGGRKKKGSDEAVEVPEIGTDVGLTA